MAALGVLLFHIAEMMEQYTANSGLFAFCRPIWINGAAGVDLFFIISGFVMVCSTRSQFQKKNASWIFLRRRFKRIAPLYWLYTGLMLLLVLLPFTLQHTSFSLFHTLASFCFIPALNPQGLNLPLLPQGWTLCYEMYFYLLFALLLNWSAKLFMPILLLLFSLSIFIGYLFPPANPILEIMTNPLLLEFLFGCLLATYRTFLPRRIGFASLFFLIGIGLLLLQPLLQQVGLPRLVYWGVPTFFLAIGLISGEHVVQGCSPRWLILLGDSSYSLYLSHIFVLLIIATLLKKQIIPPWAPADFLVLLSLIVSCLLGIASYRFIESKIPAKNYFLKIKLNQTVS